MKYNYLLLFILLIQSNVLSGQEDVEIKKKEFKTVKTGFKIAWKNIKAGDDFYSDGGSWYRNALNEYLKANDYNSSNDGLNYKIGVSYLFSDEKQKAYEYLEKAYNINNNVSADILFLNGMALQYAGRYNEAASKYLAFLSGNVRKSDDLITRANKRLNECKYAPEILKDTLEVSIENAGKNINSESDEYSQIISPDGKKLFFASRKALKPDARNFYTDSKLDENILISEILDGKWGEANPAGKNLVTGFCETPLFIDESGEVLYIYAGYEGSGDIKYSELKNGEWKSPKVEPFGINTKDPETSFCISPSGNEIAFISNRGTAGFGGKDIYFIRQNGKKWTKPVNGGDNINSVFNEESVRYSETGDTLWFSSTGHNTIGGFDIFYSVKNSENVWGKPVNAGYPINSPFNDLFYIPSPVKSSQFFFVSDRSGGFGGLDIYSGDLLTPDTLTPAAGENNINASDSLSVKNSTGSGIKVQETQQQGIPIKEIDNISVSGISAGKNSSESPEQAVTASTSKGRKARAKKK